MNEQERNKEIIAIMMNRKTLDTITSGLTKKVDDPNAYHEGLAVIICENLPDDSMYKVNRTFCKSISMMIHD